MALAQHDWLLQLQSAIHNMAEVINSIPNTESLATHTRWIPDLRALQQTIHGLVAIVGNISAVLNKQTGQQYTMFLTDFTALLKAVVPRLNRLSTGLAETQAAGIITNADVFSVLWECLVKGSEAHGAASYKWSRLFPRDQTPFNIPLFTAFAALLQWLLLISRNPAWLSAKGAYSRERRNYDFCTVLAQPTTCLEGYSCSSPALFLHHLHDLPPAFVPLICCIVSEQLGNARPVVPCLQAPATSGVQPSSRSAHNVPIQGATPFLMLSVSQLISVLNNLGAHGNQSTAGNGMFPYLLVPAVIQFLKCTLLLPIKKLLSEPHIIHCSLLCLYGFLRVSLNEAVTRPGEPLSLSDREANISSVGLPLHANPYLSSAALETDTRLLHALGIIMSGGDELLACCQLQMYVLEGWRIGAFLYESSNAVQRVMAVSVVGLGKQCSLHALLLMRLLKSEQPSQSGQSGTRPPGSKQQRQQQRQQTVLDEIRQKERKLDLFGRENMQEIRGLMSRTSNFLNLIQQSQLTKTGPGYDTLSLWRTMPGWAAAVEVLERKGGNSPDLYTICFTSMAAGESLTLLKEGSSNLTTLRLSASLAATVRKLLWPHLQRETAKDAVGGVHLMRHTTGHCLRLWRDHQTDKHHPVTVPGIVQVLVRSLSKLDGLLSCAFRCNRIATTTSSSGAFSDVSRSDCTTQQRSQSSHLPQKCKVSRQAPPTSRSGDLKLPPNEESQASKHLCVCTLLHQVQAILLLTLTQVCLWVKECRAVGAIFKETKTAPPLGWLEQALEPCWHLQNTQLRAVCELLLTESALSLPHPQSEVGLVWERYAITHFNGRLLPGCCNLRCSSLSGVSEAALKTQLCSGCRRARYCSVQCQREAWLEGGHSTVCSEM